MPKYLIVATYSPEGMKGVLREGGSERRKMIADMAKNLEGELESFYYAFGSHDVYSVVDLPDNVTAAAMATHISAGGMVRCEVTVHCRSHRRRWTRPRARRCIIARRGTERHGGPTCWRSCD